MIIAINSITFLKQAGHDYFYDYLLKTAISQTDHQFVFIGNGPVVDNRLPVKNIVYVNAAPKANNRLAWKFWLDFTLPAIARKHKADVLLHTNGVCSLRTTIIQYIFIYDLSVINFPVFFSKSEHSFFKKNMPAFLEKANTIFTGSDFHAKEIIQKFSFEADKIQSLQLPISGLFQRVDWEEKESIKEQYADGKEYFLFSGAIHSRYNLVNLLKAFSFFKKRQKSNMQLIIASPMVPANDPFIENLKTYKYRKEVSVLMDLPDQGMAKITAAAYAFVYPCLYDGPAVFSLQAMQCGVPVIAGISGAFSEIAGDAALYVDPENFEDIAQKMMLVFKDENHRSELIKEGKLIMQKLNEKMAEGQLWNTILRGE